MQQGAIKLVLLDICQLQEPLYLYILTNPQSGNNWNLNQILKDICFLRRWLVYSQTSLKEPSEEGTVYSLQGTLLKKTTKNFLLYYK